MNFGIQINSVKQPIKSTLWVLDSRLSVGHQPSWSFWSRLRNFQRCRAPHQIEKNSRSTKHNQCRAGLERFCVGCACLMWYHATSFPVLDLWCCSVGDWNTSIPKSPRSRAGIPSMRKSSSRDDYFSFCSANCVRLMSVSCTSNLLARTCDFQKRTNVHLVLISSLPNLPQNQNPETILVCIIVLYFLTWQCCLNSSVWWMYEIRRTIVRHKLWSMEW